MGIKKYSLFLVVLSVVLILDFTYSKFLTHQISTHQKKINISHKNFHHQISTHQKKNKYQS